MLDTEILIIGGGPAGATLAFYLAKAGIKTILIQRNMHFKKPCGGGIRLDSFEEFDIDITLIKHYVKNIALVHKKEQVDVDISSMPIAIVDRISFDIALREKAEVNGAELVEGTFVSSHVEDGHRVTKVKVSGEVKEITSEYLVGADGVNSKVRKSINGDEVSALLTQYIDVETTGTQSCSFHFGSDVAGKYYAWSFPHANGLNIGTLAEKNRPYMQNLCDNLQIELETKVLGYKIPHYSKPLFYRDKVFFVGDSAEQVLPFTYEGIYYAMSSAKILAESIIAKEVPTQYEKRWRQKYETKFQVLASLQKIFLRNDFMISVMMRMYKNPKVQKKMLSLWLGKQEIQLNGHFFLSAFKSLWR